MIEVSLCSKGPLYMLYFAYERHLSLRCLGTAVIFSMMGMMSQIIWAGSATGVTSRMDSYMYMIVYRIQMTVETSICAVLRTLNCPDSWVCLAGYSIIKSFT